MTGTPESAVSGLPVRRLLIWRHGRTEWNGAGRFQGQYDVPLDDHGRLQAARVAPHLASTLDGQHAVVVSSDLGRAVDTASALTDLLDVPLLVDARLREHGLGAWEGLTRDEVAGRYPDQYADWLAGRPVQGRGDEDQSAVAHRAVAALEELPQAEVAVVVTHAGTAGRLIEALLGLGPEHRRIFGPLANCAWSELVAQGTRWRVLRHNSTLPDGGGPDGSASADASSTVRDADRTSPEAGAPPAVSDADAVV